MRLKTYLLTEGRTTPINIDVFVKNIKKKCYQMLDTYRNNGWKNFYYRGIDSEFNGSFGFVQPSKFKRESMWANRNTYTVLIDNLPSWSAYPKRSKSVIMTTSRNNAQGRAGNNIPYIMFPVNNSKIGICPDDDIWDSFPQLMRRFGLTHMANFNDYFIADLVAHIGKGQYDQDEWDDLKQLFNTIIPDPDTEKGFRASHTIDKFDLEPYIGKKLGDAVIPWLDPKKNGFKLFTPRNKVPTKNIEAWTDGDCYLIAPSHLKIVQELL